MCLLFCPIFYLNIVPFSVFEECLSFSSPLFDRPLGDKDLDTRLGWVQWVSTMWDISGGEQEEGLAIQYNWWVVRLYGGKLNNYNRT